MGINFAPNKVQVEFGSYIHYWRGVPKVGKTTLFRDVVLEEYGALDKGLLLSLGQEIGYKAIDGIYAFHVPTWQSLMEVLEEVIKNKGNNDFKVIAFDTVDELVKLATEETLDASYRKTSRVAKSLNDAFGGFGKGQDYLIQLVDKVIYKVKQAGYGLVFIGHTKEKTITEKGASEGYQRLTSNMPHRMDEIFANKADVIATLYTERVVRDGQVKSSERYIYFRDDGFVESGSRFAEIVDKVPFGDNGARAYLDALYDGVRASSTEDLTNLSEMKASEIAERDKHAKDFIGEENREDVLELLKEVYSDNKDEVNEVLSDFGVSKFQDVESKDLTELKQKLQEIKENK